MFKDLKLETAWLFNSMFAVVAGVVLVSCTLMLTRPAPIWAVQTAAAHKHLCCRWAGGKLISMHVPKLKPSNWRHQHKCFYCNLLCFYLCHASHKRNFIFMHCGCAIFMTSSSWHHLSFGQHLWYVSCLFTWTILFCSAVACTIDVWCSYKNKLCCCSNFAQTLLRSLSLGGSTAFIIRALLAKSPLLTNIIGTSWVYQDLNAIILYFQVVCTILNNLPSIHWLQLFKHNKIFHIPCNQLGKLLEEKAHTGIRTSQIINIW